IRAIKLEHLVLVHRQHQGCGRTFPTLTIDQVPQGFCRVIWRHGTAAAPGPRSVACDRPGNVVSPELKKNLRIRVSAVEQPSHQGESHTSTYDLGMAEEAAS
ncbi:MAG TPA: hypothetical protein VIN33_03620, partial [Marinobacter sp.]